MSKLKELQEKRGKLYEKMKELLGKEGEVFDAEKRAQFDAVNAEMDVLTADVNRIKAADKAADEFRQVTEIASGGDKKAEAREKEYRETFWRAMKRGCFVKGPIVGTMESLRWKPDVDEPELKAKIEEYRGWKVKQLEKRDQEAGTQSISYTQGAAGGYFVPAGFVYDVEIATKYFCPMADGSVIRILETATGNVLPYPTNNDTNQAWYIIGEAQQVSDQGQTSNYPTPGTAPSGQPGDLGMSQVTFGAWKGTTGLVRVSLELLQDSAFDLEDFLKNAFAVRMGRGYEYYLTRGSGVNQPEGILTAVVASGIGAVIATGSSTNDGSAATGANSIGTTDLVTLEHQVDPTYRRGAKFMFHDNTLKQIKTLLDKYGRQLWVPGLSSNAPDTILGYEYVINQSMPQIAAAANTVLFGSLQKFVMRKVRDLSVLRLDERYADYGEVAWIAFSRIDSQLVDGGTHPVAFLQMHS
jgi:HK97 family phage major capsid protein